MQRRVNIKLWLWCRSFAPPAAHLVKDLYFDYSDSSAVAAASFLDINAFKVIPDVAGAAVFQLMCLWTCEVRTAYIAGAESLSLLMGE